MRKNFLAVSAAIVIGVLSLVNIVYASAGVRINGVTIGTATDINIGKGTNWTFDGSILTVNGLNWADAKALDASYGSHSGINWTSLGV